MLWAAQQEHLPAEQVRRVTVPDALVDTGATLLSMPTRLIRQLGLNEQYQEAGAEQRRCVRGCVFTTPCG